MTDAPIGPTEDELRSGLRAIAAWSEPAAAPPLPEATTVVHLERPPVPSRRWPMRLAAAAILVVVALAAVVLVGQRSTSEVDFAADPSIDGVLERLPSDIETLDVVDIEGLRAAADGDDPTAAEKAEILIRQVETNAAPSVWLPGSETFEFEEVRAWARATAPGGVIVTVIATTQNEADLAAALREAGLDEDPDGTFRRPMTYDPRTTDPEDRLMATAAAASIEPGYLTVAASVIFSESESEPSVEVPEPAGPPEPLREVLAAAPPFLVLAGLVDPSVATGATCGGAEARTYGNDGHALILRPGPDGRVLADPDRSPDLFGQGDAGSTRTDGNVTVIEVIPDEIGFIPPYPLGVLTSDVEPLVEC